MKKKIDTIAAGLNGLLTSTVQADANQDTPKPGRKIYKTVCYSIPPEVAEKIKYIAYWDRKKLNTVVTEAFEQYAAAWEPQKETKPKKF